MLEFLAKGYMSQENVMTKHLKTQKFQIYFHCLKGLN